MNLTAVCAQLQKTPDSLPWSEKVALAARISAGMGRRDKLPASAVLVLGILATDGKWEVRKAVADLLHLVPDTHFHGLAGQIGADDNHYVRTATQKALERRSRSQVTNRRHGRGLKKVESEIERVARTHGTEVAKVVRDQAVRLYEGLVGASVHEMRAVLTAMRSNMDSLLTEAAKGNGEQAAARLGPRLRNSLQFIEQLLADMRLYSQVPAKVRHTELLAGMVQEALTMVQSEFSATGCNTTGIEICLTVPAELALPAFRAQVVLACRNLIKNAHEAILVDDERHGRGSIQIGAAQNGTWLELRVVDNGMGLSEQELSDVRQFIPGKTSKPGGTGFGLPIAQRYVSFHGGTVEIESVDGKGTTVLVRLPLDPNLAV